MSSPSDRPVVEKLFTDMVYFDGPRLYTSVGSEANFSDLFLLAVEGLPPIRWVKAGHAAKNYINMGSR